MDGKRKIRITSFGGKGKENFTAETCIADLHGRRVGEEKAISAAGFQRQVAHEAVPVARRVDVAADDAEPLGRLRRALLTAVDSLGAAQLRVGGLPRRQGAAAGGRRTDRDGAVTATGAARQQRRLGARPSAAAVAHVPVHLNNRRTSSPPHGVSD